MEKSGPANDAAKNVTTGDGKDAPPPADAPGMAITPEDDWWDNFRKAVEDPDVSIYEYLRNNAMAALDLDNKAGLSESIVQARKAALRELFSLTDPEELSKKLKLLESNSLLFNMNARAIMRVSRAVLDTYVKTREEARGGKTAPEDIGAAIGANLKKELAEAEGEINPALQSVARTLKDKDEKEVADTIHKAAQQMREERNLLLLIGDAARFVRSYLKPDNIVNIAIIALPLVTWQYRWALALGLGAYSGRHTLYHSWKAAAALYKGDRKEAKAQGRAALKTLKEAGGNVLLITLTPVLAKYPALAAGFLGFVIEAAYNTVLDTFNRMLAEEEKKPGSTPIGKRVKAGIRTFFATYQDTLARLSAKALKTLAPHTVTDTIESLSLRMPMTKMRKIVVRGWMLSGALATRFNRLARAKASAAAKELGQLRDDVIDAGRDFVNAVESALGDAAQTATQRESERIAAALLLEERARAIAAEEAAQKEAAAKEASEKAALQEQAKAEEQAAYTEGASQGEDAGASASEAAEEAQMSAEEAAAIRRRKLESVARHRREDAQQRRTMRARPDGPA